MNRFKKEFAPYKNLLKGFVDFIKDRPDVTASMKRSIFSDPTNRNSIKAASQTFLDFMKDTVIQEKNVILGDIKVSFRDLLNSAASSGLGCLQIIIDAEGNLGVGITGDIGISFDIATLLYWIGNGFSFVGCPNNFIASVHVGVTISGGIAAGGDVGFNVGLHTSKCNGVDGFSFCGQIEGSAGFGGQGSIAVPLPPDDPNQFVLGVSAGGKAELSLGFNATAIFLYFDKDFFMLPATPSTTVAKLTGHPSLYYSRFSWDQMRFDVSKMNFMGFIMDGNGKYPTHYWEKLGWTKKSWDFEGAPPPRSMETPWNQLPWYQKKAVEDLGYIQKTWDAPMVLDAWYYDRPDEYWDSWDWREMLENEMSLWESLGWNEHSWMGHASPPASFFTSFAYLSWREQASATELGYDQGRWDASSSLRGHKKVLLLSETTEKECQDDKNNEDPASCDKNKEKLLEISCDTTSSKLPVSEQGTNIYIKAIITMVMIFVLVFIPPSPLAFNLLRGAK